MSFYSWNVIAKVAEHRGITQAANLLNLSPSAVSHMVKKVEEELGYPLFLRGARRPHPDGQRPGASSLCPELSEGRLRPAGGVSAAEGLCGGCRPHRRLQQRDPQLAARHPEAVSRKVPQHQDLHPAVQRRADQTVDCRRRDRRGHRLQLLLQRAVVYPPAPDAGGLLHPGRLCPPRRRLHDRPGPAGPAGDPAAEDFDQETNAILSGAGIPLDSVFRIDNDESCYEFIRQGFGFRITAAITYPQDDRIRRYPLENAPYRTIGLITAFPQYISPL